MIIVFRLPDNQAGKSIGVIRIKTFSKTTSEDVSAAIKQLEAKGKSLSYIVYCNIKNAL